MKILPQALMYSCSVKLFLSDKNLHFSSNNYVSFKINNYIVILHTGHSLDFFYDAQWKNVFVRSSLFLQCK